MYEERLVDVGSYCSEHVCPNKLTNDDIPVFVCTGSTMCMKTGVMASKWLRSGPRVPNALPTRDMAFSVLLALRFFTAPFASLLRCSIWRSVGMFLPG